MMIQDLRHGTRLLCRNPGFTAVAVAALALGIGVNIVVFTAYKAIFARPLDARDSKEMINIALVRDAGSTEFNFSYPDYLAYRDSVGSLSGLITASSPQTMRLSTAEAGLGKLGCCPPRPGRPSLPAYSLSPRITSRFSACRLCVVGPSIP